MNEDPKKRLREWREHWRERWRGRIVNPERVRLARQSRGMRLGALAKACGFESRQWQRMEQGQRPIPLSCLDTLAQMTNYPPHFFTQDDPPALGYPAAWFICGPEDIQPDPEIVWQRQKRADRIARDVARDAEVKRLNAHIRELERRMTEKQEEEAGGRSLPG